MMYAGHDFWTAIYVLFTRVSGLALISFGGVNTVLPALHHMAVNEQHWMTDRDFANMFALASVSPGPNFMVLTLIGYKAAGAAGALVATFTLCVPTSLLAFAVVKLWDRFKTARSRNRRFRRCRRRTARARLGQQHYRLRDHRRRRARQHPDAL